MPKRTSYTPQFSRTFDPMLQSRNQSIGVHYAREQKNSVAKPIGAPNEEFGGLDSWSEIIPDSIYHPGSLGENREHLPHVPGAGGKMLLTLLALQLLSPAIARSIENEAQGKDMKPEARPSTDLRPDALTPTFKEEHPVSSGQMEAEQEADKNINIQINRIKGSSTRHERSARKTRTRYVVTAPQHVATIIGRWPTRRDVARQIMISNGLNPDEYRESQTVNAPGRTSVMFQSYTNDTLLDQYLRSQLVVLGIAGDGSRDLTQLPKLDSEYKKVWADFAATQLPEIRRKTTRTIVDLLSSSFGVNPKKDSAVVYQLKSSTMLSNDVLKAIVRVIENLHLEAFSLKGTSIFLIHFPQRDQTVAVWESDGSLHMRSVPKTVFEGLKSMRAPNAWIDDHVGDSFSDDLRDKERFGEEFSAEPISGAVSPRQAAEAITVRALDPERLEKAGYEETPVERFVHATRGVLIPYYDAIRKAMDGDVEAASKSAAEEALYDLLFSVVGKAAGKVLAKGVKAIGKSDIESFRKAVDKAVEELHIPKAEDVGEGIKSICKRDVGRCVHKPHEVRAQKHAAKAADRHKLPRPGVDAGAWARGLTTKRVADLFGNSLNPDGSYRLTAAQALAGFDNHLQQIQQEINSAIAVFSSFGTTTEQGKKFMRWVAKAILSAAKDSRFDFDRKTLKFGTDLGYLKLEKRNGRVLVYSRP